MTREKGPGMKRQGRTAYPAYVHSRVTLYHASKIDLRYCRSLHSCATCHLGQVEDSCGAIHFGICAAVAMPLVKFRRGPQNPSGKAQSPVYHSSANFLTSGRKDGPKTRSLAILREGQELAGHRAGGLLKLNPQRQVIVQGAPMSQGLVVSSQSRGSGGGLAITIQHGQTNTSSGGNTDIKIQGQGHEIHIQGSGGQNIRVHPALSAGGRGPIIRIHGHGQAQYPTSPKALPALEPVDSAPPAPSQHESSTLPQKPTARVAPAVASPSSASATPPFPLSLSPTSPLPAASPVLLQPGLSVNNKEIGNHVSLAPPTTAKSGAELIKGRQTQSIKDLSSHANGDGLLLHQSTEVYPSNRKLHSKDGDSLQQHPQHWLPSQKGEVTDNKSSSKGPVETRDENKVKKRGIRPLSSIHIPQFYFPSGKPSSGQEMDMILQKVSEEFSGLEEGKAYKQQMGLITKACGLPLYWKILLFRASGGSSDGYVTYQNLSVLLRKLYQTCQDEASKFMRLSAKPGSKLLDFDDFDPLVQDVVETHPGLTFLQDAPEFHSRYVTTVISRIMFSVNRSWTGRITLPELRKSNFLQTVMRLEEEEDINQIKDYFSYEHFYVIYCKFWELDKDHDLYIDKNDLARHNDHALNSRLIDRIFSGAVTRGPDFQEGRMSYREFVWFLLAEEDKKHATSIEYWFRCMDLDGDGVISMYEMEYFHEEQMNKMETLGIERLPFEDTVCQMMDMVSPKIEGKITLGDLKACKMTNIFFDTFFNLDKFLEHEQRDPFANARDPNAEPVEMSDWNRYAEEEYDILVADEGNADMEEGNYEDDFEPEDDDEGLREQMLRLAEAGPQRSPSLSHTAEDIYDFSNTTNLGY